MKMLAAVKTKPAPGLEVKPVDRPAIGSRDVLLKVKAASICGTDLHIYSWNEWARDRVRTLPMILGHELFGEVIEIGSEVKRARIGDRVSAESHIICRTCFQCRTGLGHVCRKTKILGLDRNGSFAEYVALPAENIWPVSAGTPTEVAVLMENFGNAVHACTTAPVAGKQVLITGCGPVGCMAIAVCKLLGARTVMASDISEYRLSLARRLGADLVIQAETENLFEAVNQQTNHEGVDVLLEMSGAPSAFRDGLRSIRPGGQAVLLGLPSAPVKLDLADQIIFKGISLFGVIGRRIWETWQRADELINSGAIDLRPIVTHHFDLKDIDRAFAVMASRQSGKIILYP